LTALTSTAEVLVRSVFQYSREWQILGAQFAVTGFCDTPTESDWALTLTHDEFVSAAVFAATLRRDRILLRFHSPTAFARSLSPAGPTTIHFPEVLAIFGALRRKFVEFSEFTETPPSVEELTSYISLGRYDVHTRRLSFGAHNTGRTGFLEDVELLVDRRASSELVDWIHILCRYGFFCGMGVSTSWGMGQVRVEPHEDLVSGVLSKYKANSAVAG